MFYVNFLVEFVYFKANEFEIVFLCFCLLELIHDTIS